MPRFLRTAALLLIVFAAPLGAAMTFPDLVSRFVVPRLLYFPTKLAEDRADPAARGLRDAEQAWLETSDAVRLHAWWVPARAPESPRCGTAVYFHGNAGNLAGRAPIAEALALRGLDVLLVDYRGYGRSEGVPSEEGLYRDGDAAWLHLRRTRNVPAGEILLAGHSLGAAVAARVAAGRSGAGLVLTAPFRNLPSAARDLYPWLPAAVFEWSDNQFDTETRAAEVTMPLLVARGGRDDLMPESQVRAVYDAAAGPKRWLEAPGATHDDLWWNPVFGRALDAFLENTLNCR